MRRHGNRVSGVFELIKQDAELAKRITPALPFIVADLVFCAQHEMVVHLEDLLRRRLPLLILSKMAPAELQRLARIAAKALAWDDDMNKQGTRILYANGLFIKLISGVDGQRFLLFLTHRMMKWCSS